MRSSPNPILVDPSQNVSGIDQNDITPFDDGDIELELAIEQSMNEASAMAMERRTEDEAMSLVIERSKSEYLARKTAEQGEKEELEKIIQLSMRESSKNSKESASDSNYSAAHTATPPVPARPTRPSYRKNSSSTQVNRKPAPSVPNRKPSYLSNLRLNETLKGSKNG